MRLGSSRRGSRRRNSCCRRSQCRRRQLLGLPVECQRPQDSTSHGPGLSAVRSRWQLAQFGFGASHQTHPTFPMLARPSPRHIPSTREAYFLLFHFHEHQCPFLHASHLLASRPTHASSPSSSSIVSVAVPGMGFLPAFSLQPLVFLQLPAFSLSCTWGCSLPSALTSRLCFFCQNASPAHSPAHPQPTTLTHRPCTSTHHPEHPRGPCRTCCRATAAASHHPRRRGATSHPPDSPLHHINLTPPPPKPFLPPPPNQTSPCGAHATRPSCIPIDCTAVYACAFLTCCICMLFCNSNTSTIELLRAAPKVHARRAT